MAAENSCGSQGQNPVIELAAFAAGLAWIVYLVVWGDNDPEDDTE